MEDMNLNLTESEVSASAVQSGEKETFSEKMKKFFKGIGPFFKKCWHNFTHMKRKTIVDIIVWIILALGAFVVLIPFIWMILATFKDATEIYASNIFPKKWTGENYALMWERVDLLRGFLNSFLTTVPVVLVQVVVSAMAAYAFAKLDFKGKNSLFLVMLSTMMVPFAVVMLPQAWLFGRLGLTEGPLAVIIPKLFGSITTVFFLRQFLYGIPKSISEAAVLDGAGYTRIFVSIILPLIMPALATQFILSFIGNWNDYLGPMLFINDEAWYTLPLMVNSLNKNSGGTASAIPQTLAASLISLIPIVIVFAVFQKKIIGSIVFSAVKG